MNKKIFFSTLSILSALAMMGGATFAYFTSQAASDNNTFTAGTLNIELNQDGQTDLDGAAAGVQVTQNWQPGESADVLFNIKNTGSLPVNLKGYALGSWSGAGEPTLVKATKIEFRLNSTGSWNELIANSAGLTGEFYYSPTGGNAALTALSANDTLNLRLTVLFDSTADSSYEGQTYTAQLKVDAKQTNASNF